MRLQYVLSVCILLMMPTNGQTQELLRYKSQPDQQVYKHKSSTLIDNSSINYWDRAAWTSTERFADSADGVIEVSVVYTKVDQTLTLKHHMTAHTASGLAMGDATSGPLDQDVRGLLKDRTFSHRMTDRGELTSFTAPDTKGLLHRDRASFDSVVALLGLECATRFPELPLDAVGVGDTWSSNRTRSVAIPEMEDSNSISLASSFRVKKVKKRKGFSCFEIEGELVVDSVIFIVAGDVPFLETGSGKGKVKLLFDYERGLVQKYEVETDSKSQIDDLTKVGESLQEARTRRSYKWELKE